MARVIFFSLALIVCLPATVPTAAESVTQTLEKQLARDKDPSVRAEAAWQLGQLGSTGSVPALAKALNDSSSAVRANAAASLWHLGAASKPAIPELMNALDDRSAQVVGNAAGALTKLGVPKAEILPAYRRLLDEPDCKARVIAVTGLVNEAPATDLFDHAWRCADWGEDSDMKHDAREALRKIVNRRDRVLVPQILDALKRVGLRDASDLTSAIGQIEPPVKEAVPILTTLIDARNEYTQRGALYALGRMGAAALPAVDDVVRCLQSQAAVDTREEAAKALGKIGRPAAASAVPALTKVAEGDKWPKVRRAAIEALGEMRTDAKSAIPVLRAALKDPDSGISMSARNALFRVEPGKNQEVADIADQSRPVEKSNLHEDLSQLSATLPGRIPEVFELIIYDNFAMAKAPYAESRSGRGKFTYRAGTVTGPEEESNDDCKKIIALAKVDFSVVPKIVKQAPGLAGAPTAKIGSVQLTPGVFCKNHAWLVTLGDAGMVQFKLDGKLDKVIKF